jgi:phage protein U
LFHAVRSGLLALRLKSWGSLEGREIAVVIKEDRLMSRGHWGGFARYGLPGLMAGLILSWWVGGQGSTVKGQGMVPTSEANGTIAFTTSSNNSSSQLLYLIDTKSQAFAVYRVEPNNSNRSGTVKLEAARQYRYDLKLSEFNNQPPEVSQIEGMVKSMSPVK